MPPRRLMREKSSLLVRLIFGARHLAGRKVANGMKNPSIARGFSVTVRVLAAVGGGYAVAAGLAALAAVALPAMRMMPRSEAVVLASMLAFLVYLALLIWAFADRRLARLCMTLAAAGAASWGGAWAIARMVPGS